MSCILTEQIKALQEAVQEKGGIPALRKMSTGERIEFLAKYVDNASDKAQSNANLLNRQIENEMLKPAQVEAIQQWVESSEANLEKWLEKLPEDKRANTLQQQKDIVQMVSESNQILNPAEGQPFLEALVKQKLGFEANVNDTRILLGQANKIQQLKNNFSEVVPGWEHMDITDFDVKTASGDAQKARVELGRSLLEFKNTMDRMKLEAKLSQLKNVKGAEGQIKKVMNLLEKAAGTLKAGKASFDLSGGGRQLWSLWVTHPTLGAKTWWRGVQTLGATLTNNVDASNQALMELMTRPNALNGNYEKFGLDLGVAEEAFPHNWLSQVEKSLPIKPFTASEKSHNIMMQMGRAETFDMLLQQSKSEAHPNGDLQLLKAQDAGGIVNAITGRGQIHKLFGPGVQKWANLTLFAPRWVMSRVEMISNLQYARHYFEKTPHGLRARAAVNTTSFALAMSFLSIVARSVLFDDPESWEEMKRKTFNPLSTDFMQARVGNLRIDLSGATAGNVRMASRLITGMTITGEGAYQNKTRGDVFWNYLNSKQSPLFSQAVWVYLLARGAATGEPQKTSFGEQVEWQDFWKAILPISTEKGLNIITKPDDKATRGLGFVLEFLGIGEQYWEASDKNVGKSARVVREQERLAFKSNTRAPDARAAKNAAINTKLSGAKRERANSDFTKEYNKSIERLMNSTAYRRMNDAKKKEAQSKARSEVMKGINKKYGIK